MKEIFYERKQRKEWSLFFMKPVIAITIRWTDEDNSIIEEIDVSDCSEINAPYMGKLTYKAMLKSQKKKFSNSEKSILLYRSDIFSDFVDKNKLLINFDDFFSEFKKLNTILLFNILFCKHIPQKYKKKLLKDGYHDMNHNNGKNRIDSMNNTLKQLESIFLDSDLEWAINEFEKENEEKSRQGSHKTKSSANIKEPSVISNRIRLEVINRDNGTCQCCGRSAPEVPLEIDHIIPKSLGGKNKISNLQVLCKDCNRAKSNKYILWNNALDTYDKKHIRK